MANYILIVDLGDATDSMQYEALTRLMRDFGLIPRGPEALRPPQFSLTSSLPLAGLKRMVEDRITVELQPHFTVDAYEIKQLLQFSTTRPSDCRRFH
jgi:hypothetical protein